MNEGIIKERRLHNIKHPVIVAVFYFTAFMGHDTTIMPFSYFGGYGGGYQYR